MTDTQYTKQQVKQQEDEQIRTYVILSNATGYTVAINTCDGKTFKGEQINLTNESVELQTKDGWRYNYITHILLSRICSVVVMKE